MPDTLAIRATNVTKTYRLFGSPRAQMIDALGLQKLGIGRRASPTEFRALDGVSFEVPKGHRLGIVGRNGAGKTTLLKLICGNYAPTSGSIEVFGTVQALMSAGIGFHPEFTGLENIRAALQYSGLGHAAYEEALSDICDFCELGIYLEQPFKTYSQGMQARLMFATATAIRPDIVIVDEILGAGDAYFVAKSKLRMERLVAQGCTLLLVSHSMAQVLELCSEAIWLDNGIIRMRSDAFAVVKAYEKFMHGRKPLGLRESENAALEIQSADDDAQNVESSESDSLDAGRRLMQEPAFRPHQKLPELSRLEITHEPELKFIARGGISRWESDTGIKIVGFTMLDERGEGNVVLSLKPAKFLITLCGEMKGDLACRYGVVIHNHLGECVTRIWSPIDRFRCTPGLIRHVELLMNPLQLGPGEYVVGLSVIEGSRIEAVDIARRYDLLGRSFEMKVELQDSMRCLSANFFHSGEWSFTGPHFAGNECQRSE
ncbi:MAG TPA: polysaccharide ABC transporter ATP-binding protein [Gammaproteobacteria bacterium]|nr:polysaccharide ABC transporter ATP-binding protein [Gammaproteobacteria bacterium]